jgi:hypothetical protein
VCSDNDLATASGEQDLELVSSCDSSDMEIQNLQCSVSGGLMVSSKQEVGKRAVGHHKVPLKRDLHQRELVVHHIEAAQEKL